MTRITQNTDLSVRMNMTNLTIDGVKAPFCYELDDVAGIALVCIEDDKRRSFWSSDYHDWKPGEFDFQGHVSHWVHGKIAFDYLSEEARQKAEAEQRSDPFWDTRNDRFEFAAETVEALDTIDKEAAVIAAAAIRALKFERP